MNTSTFVKAHVLAARKPNMGLFALDRSPYEGDCGRSQTSPQTYPQDVDIVCKSLQSNENKVSSR